MALALRKKIESGTCDDIGLKRDEKFVFRSIRKKIREILSRKSNNKEVGISHQSYYELVKAGQCDNYPALLLGSIEWRNYVGGDDDDCVGDDVDNDDDRPSKF